MTDHRDEKPFASLLGKAMTSVEFVVNDYVQLRFDVGATLNAYTHPVVVVGAREFRWGEPGYRDALCERVLARVRAGWAAPEEIVLHFDDGAMITISNRAEDAGSAEAATLSTDAGLWVWRPGIGSRQADAARVGQRPGMTAERLEAPKLGAWGMNGSGVATGVRARRRISSVGSRARETGIDPSTSGSRP